jgi:aminomethyltransferase
MTPSPPATATRLSPLHERHEALGAALTDFAGWSMPVRYSSEVAEHHAVRTAAGVFDVSHMGQIHVTGPAAAAALDHALTARMSAVAVGRAKYALLCAPDGGVLDDVIVYRVLADSFLVVADAGNAPLVARELAARCAGFACEVADASEDTALIAVQGPRAREAVLALTRGGGDDLVAGLRYYASAPVVAEGSVPVTVARTGYTGEDGYEVFCSAHDAPAVWDAVLRHGGPSGAVPCGLAARDSLRLEAAMPLYGRELTSLTTPAEAGLGWAVALDDGSGGPRDFVGAAALAEAASRVGAWRADPAAAPVDARVLVGLAGDGRRAARTGYPVLDGDGALVGEVTSGAPSPTLGRQIALAYAHPRVAVEGAAVAVEVRGRLEEMSVCALPFYRRPREGGGRTEDAGHG